MKYNKNKLNLQPMQTRECIRKEFIRKEFIRKIKKFKYKQYTLMTNLIEEITNIKYYLRLKQMA